MSNRWERSLAAELAMSRLEKECCTDPIVRHCLTAARDGHADLLTALVECIKALATARAAIFDEAIKAGWIKAPRPILTRTEMEQILRRGDRRPAEKKWTTEDFIAGPGDHA